VEENERSARKSFLQACGYPVVHYSTLSVEDHTFPSFWEGPIRQRICARSAADATSKYLENCAKFHNLPRI
jgi:hypothetical protein